MDLRWTRRLAMGLSLVALGAVGCAEERDPINRVQADALSKEFFVGKLADPSDDPVFFWRNFVVDGSEAQSMVGIGSWSGVDRIRWEITENMLVARKAYPIADGADNKGYVNSDPANGTIVAAYPIVKHFDIKKAYNPQTGEELNIIEENASDRVWYQRSHFRVDWSVNMVESPLWFDMFLGKIFGDIKVTPLAYYVNDKAHPDAPHFETDKGYFDITSKFWVEPEQTHIWGMQFPTCVIVGLYTGAAVDNCDPQEAVIRSSYWKVDSIPSAQDFEPFENTYANLDIVGNPGGLGDSYTVGIVTPPRVDWDPQYGYTDPGMQRNLHVHNIWKQSHILTGSCKTDADCGGGSCLKVQDGGGAKACTVPCSYKNAGDGDNNGVDDQCPAGGASVIGNGGRTEQINLVPGSQCSSRNWCTLPVRNRTIKTVGYWMNKETPAELTDPWDPNSGQRLGVGPTEDMIDSWNQLMRFSVAKARETECRRTNTGDRGQCHNLYFYPGDNTEMLSYGAWAMEKPRLRDGNAENQAGLEDVVLTACHNPVRAYDHPTCGKVGYSARVGDLRHNFLYYWPYASRAPWGGIANWNADPLTGMIVGASATTMGRSATYAAAMVRDIIMVANGELTFEDITDGTPAKLYERRLQNGYTPEVLGKEDIQRKVDSINASHAAEMVAPKEIQGATLPEKLGKVIKMQKETVAGLGLASTSHLEYDAIASKVRGSQIEAQLVDPSWVLDAAGMNPASTKLSDVMDLVSPLRGMDHAQTEQVRQLIDLRMQARGVCYTDIYAGNVGNLDVQGVAKFFANKFNDDAIKQNYPEYGEASPGDLSKKRAELIYNQLWKETYKGIQLHEVGHSLGMLHQFASSFDSLNYQPQYWQLRTQDGAVTQSCNGTPRCPAGDTNCALQSDTCMGPRYLDPETADELGQGQESRPGIHYFGHTSTMEYQNERFFETVGLGQYDMHTMNMLYGRVLQTFDVERGYAPDLQGQFAYRHFSQLTEQNYVNWTTPLGAFMQPMHYTEQARQLMAFDPARCRPATDEEKARAEWRIVNGKVCAPPPKDYAFFRDFENGIPADAPSWMVPGADDFVKYKVRNDASTAGGAVRWPIRWGVTSNSYPHTNPSDAGADIYEVTQETIKKFEYSYPFHYFRRKNRDWYYRTVPSRVSRGFYERLRAFHWSMANSNARFASFGDATFGAIGGSDDWWRPYLMAETDMFNAIVKAFLMPQIGAYKPCITQAGSTVQLYDTETCDGLNIPSSFVIDASTGRYIDPDFDGSAQGGGSWDYQSYVNWTGYTFEKSDASRALTDGRSVFFTISRENYLDGRNVNINFRSDMPEAVDRLLGGVLAGDFQTIAPYVKTSDGPNPPVYAFDLAGAAEPKRPANVALLFPNIGYKQQVGTLVFAHIFARLNGDLTLANKMRIYLDGSTQQISIPTADQVRFHNPESGFTYIARRYGDWVVDGKTVDKGIASRMINTANLLLAKAYQVQGGPTNPTLDAFGQVQLILDANGKPQPVLNSDQKPDIAATNAFRSYVGLLDASVQLQNMVGYGPFNGWGGIDLE